MSLLLLLTDSALRPYSEFVYEALGATPSIQVGGGKWVSTPARASGDRVTASKKLESSPNDKRLPATEKDANVPS
jgi:hypothetical protein